MGSPLQGIGSPDSLIFTRGHKLTAVRARGDDLGACALLAGKVVIVVAGCGKEAQPQLLPHKDGLVRRAVA